MVAAAVEDERSGIRVGTGLERPADQDRVVAAVQLLLELAGEPGDRAAEDGNLVDQLVFDAGELLLTARLRRKAAGELLLAGPEDVDAEAA